METWRIPVTKRSRKSAQSPWGEEAAAAATRTEERRRRRLNGREAAALLRRRRSRLQVRGVVRAISVLFFSSKKVG